MYRVCYSIRAIASSVSDVALVELNQAAVEGLAAVDLVILRHWNIAPLYSVRPRYHMPSIERWGDILTVLADGWGDCKDFAAWRLAELWQVGMGARAESIVWRRGARLTFHTFIRHADGRVEDPARILGG